MLERLTNALGATSKADVVRRAVKQLRYVLEEQTGRNEERPHPDLEVLVRCTEA